MSKKKGKKKSDGLTLLDYQKGEAAKLQQGSKRKTPPSECPKCGMKATWQPIGNDVRCQQCGHQITIIDTPKFESFPERLVPALSGNPR